MWPFHKKQRVDEENVCLNIIADYLLLLPVSGEWEENELLNALVTRGHDKILSGYVIRMIPILTAREIMKDMGITFTKSVGLLDDYRKPAKKIQFNDFPVYRAIMRSWQQINKHPNIRNIMLDSSELDAVNKALNAGSNPKNLRVGDVILIRRP
jgi:hypothetical protein